jgi:hypothetical protein
MLLWRICHIFTVGYYVTLWLNRQDYRAISIWSFSDLATKHLITLSLLTVLFAANISSGMPLKLWQRLSLHIIFPSAFVSNLATGFHAFTDYFEYGHLQGSGQVWDVYIWTFYVLQFNFSRYEYYVDNQTTKLEAELRNLS